MELEGETRVSNNGNQMTVGYMDCHRYIFDFNLCKSDDGWLTVETKEDASYFGVWVHPEKLETVQFTEHYTPRDQYMPKP